MRGRKIMKALIALALVISLLCGSAMAATLGGKILVSSATVYRGASFRSKMGTLRQGRSVKVKAIDGQWAKISYGKKTGWTLLKNVVFNKRIKAVSTKKTPIRFMTRSSLKKNTYYTGTLAKGVTVYLAGLNGSYYLFYDKSGDTMGYVSKYDVRRS